MVLGIVLAGAAGLAMVIVILRRRRRLTATTTPQAPATKVDTTPMASAPAPHPTVFICYRREDSADITGRISDRLVQRFGPDSVFKDVESIPLGQDFRTYLHEAVGRCGALLVVIGPRWQGAAAGGKRRLDDPQDHLRIEIESALQRSIPVIPVLVQGATLPHEEDLPEVLRPLVYRQSQPVRPDPDFSPDIQRLIHGIESQCRRAPAHTES